MYLLSSLVDFKFLTFRHSLAVQWLGLSAFTVVAHVQSLIGELRSHKLRSAAKNKLIN